MCECVLRARACVRRRVARVRKCARASVINDVVSPIAGLQDCPSCVKCPSRLINSALILVAQGAETQTLS